MRKQYTLKEYEGWKEYRIKNGKRIWNFENWKKKWTKKKKYKGVVKYSICFADFETTTPKPTTMEDLETVKLSDEQIKKFLENQKQSRVFLVGVMNKEKEYKQSFENMEDFFDNLISLKKESEKYILCYFHNLSFDGSYILSWLLKNGYKQTLKEKWGIPIIKKREFYYVGDNSKSLKLVMKWNGIKIVFQDSYKLINLSLEVIGEKVGISKQKEIVDYDNFNLDIEHNYPEEYYTYLYNDVLIMWEMFFGEKRLLEDLGYTKTLTMGMYAYDKVKSIIKEECEPMMNIKTFNEMNNFYRGGYCYGNLEYIGKKINKKCAHIDACSMYPSRMVEELPQGEIIEEDINNIEYSKNKIYWLTISIYNAKIKKEWESLPILPKPRIFNVVKKEFITHKLFTKNIETFLREIPKQNEPFYYFFCLEEWKHILKRYKIDYQIISIKSCDKSAYLKDKIRELFEKKAECKKLGDKSGEFLAKGVINTITGKFGQSPYLSSIFYGDKNDIPKDMEIVGEGDIYHNLNGLNSYKIRKIRNDEDKAKPVAVVAYITAKSRCNLYEYQEKLIKIGNIPLYSDTDSIAFIYNNELDFELKSDLGYWNWEEMKVKNGSIRLYSDGFKWLQPKQYIHIEKDNEYPIKLACAGVKKSIMKKVKTQDYNYDLELSKLSARSGMCGKIIEKVGVNFSKWKNYKYISIYKNNSKKLKNSI